jgi:hypothetical protein
MFLKPYYMEEEHEETKCVIRICKSKKDRQHNGQKKTNSAKNPNKTELKKNYIYLEKTIIAPNVLITLLVIIINVKTPIKRPIAKTRRHCRNSVIVKRLLQMLSSTVHF